MSRKVGLTFSKGRLDKAEPYRRALESVGLEVLDNPESITDLDGLCLGGGVDVDSSLYGEERHPATQLPEAERDSREFALLRSALKADLPLFGICRGAQLLNVYLGGSLIQHIDNDTHKVELHAVEVEAGTRLASIAGSGPHNVNSRHHQAIGRLGNGLRVAAKAADGIIEAVESPEYRFVVAVQWHPEDRYEVSEKDRLLFEAFAAETS